MALRDNVRHWLGISDPPRDGELAPYRNCELAGHHYEPRFDEKPIMVVTADDIIKFQGSKTEVETRYSGGSLKNTTVTAVPSVSLDQQIKLVEAHKEKNYLGDCCRYCGKFIRYEREP